MTDKQSAIIEKQDNEINYMQIRELTDEEWLKLPKEEILQLYKNCYSILMNYIKLSKKSSSGMREFVISEIQKGIVHPNPLTTSEMRVLDLCCKYMETHPVKK
jgi:uncharacterized membrane protein